MLPFYSHEPLQCIFTLLLTATKISYIVTNVKSNGIVPTFVLGGPVLCGEALRPMGLIKYSRNTTIYDYVMGSLKKHNFLPYSFFGET